MKYSVKILLLLPAFYFSLHGQAQEANELIAKVKVKLDKVNDYTATGILKTDVAFIKAPLSNVVIYYKKPDRYKMIKNGGISILPKGGVSVSMSSLISNDKFSIIDAGETVINKIKTRIIKLLPTDENSNVVLSTLYIDETTLLVQKAVTTTVDNGTYELTMTYGKYAGYGLPDKVIFSFNAKDYKLPKGITLDFDEKTKPAEETDQKNKKGKVEITYSSYTINKGISDEVFK
jgi:outer membrane lipoprotein-sorting protein